MLKFSRVCREHLVVETMVSLNQPAVRVGSLPPFFFVLQAIWCQFRGMSNAYGLLQGVDQTVPC